MFISNWSNCTHFTSWSDSLIWNIQILMAWLHNDPAYCCFTRSVVVPCLWTNNIWSMNIWPTNIWPTQQIPFTFHFVNNWFVDKFVFILCVSTKSLLAYCFDEKTWSQCISFCKLFEQLSKQFCLQFFSEMCSFLFLCDHRLYLNFYKMRNLPAEVAQLIEHWTINQKIGRHQVC